MFSSRGAVVSDEFLKELQKPVSKTVEEIIRRDQVAAGLVSSQPPTARTSKIEALEGGIEMANLRRDLTDQNERLQVFSNENEILKKENAQIKQDCKNLSNALTDLDKIMRKPGPGHQEIECPALERFVASAEMRNLAGDDMTAWLRSELDRFHGRCSELRDENRLLRQETHTLVSDNVKMKQELEQLKSELNETGAGIHYHRFKLPESMAPTSAETIAALNDHLIHALHEAAVKDKLLSESHMKLQDYKRQVSVIRHQQSLLYDEFAKSKKDFEEKVKEAEMKVAKIEALRMEDKVKLDEFERMLNLFSSSSASSEHDMETQFRKHAVEATRRATVARVTERRTATQFEAAESELHGIRRENERLRADSIKLQTSVMQRIGSLQRFKEAALFRVTFLQRQLDQAVPLSDYEALGKKLDECAMNYRELLDRQQTMVDTGRMADDLKVANESLQRENNNLKKELTSEKELKTGFQAVVEDFAAKGVVSDQMLSSGNVQSISRKLAALEMKELNERERADHAVRMEEQLKQVADQLEKRNKELEFKFAEISKISLDNQRIERELRDELANSVPRTVYESDRQKVTELEKAEVVLKNEVHQLKEMRDVAVMQRKGVDLRRGKIENEVESLRGQVRDFQQQSDEKAMIVRLHGQLLQLQASESFAVAQLEGSQQRISSLELELAKIERRLEEREHTLHFQRTESSNRIRQLRKTVHSLRQQFIGCVPLDEQQKVTKMIIELEDNKRKIAEELKEASLRREAVEIELASAKLKQQGLEELVASVKEGPAAAAQRLSEWHQKLENLRLEDLRNRRLIMRLEDQIAVDESAIARREQSIATLEAELVAAKRELELQQIEWEQREVYLEQTLLDMEKQIKEVSSEALQFESERDALPDSTLPQHVQLEQARDTIKKCVKGLLERGTEVKLIRKKLEDNDHRLRDAETGLLHQNRLISELRVRLSPTEQAAAMAAVGPSVETDGERPDCDESGTTGQLRRQLRVARTSIESMKRRIEQKNETIQKFEELVAQLRSDFDRQQKAYEEELRNVQARLTSDRDMLASEMNAAMLAAASSGQQLSIPTSEMITRLHELEDLDREHRRIIATLQEKLHDSEQIASRHKGDSSAAFTRLQHDVEQYKSQREEERSKLLTDLDNARRMVATGRTEIERLEHELEMERQKGPTNMMKHTMEKLKLQLSEKEKKVQQLSKALSSLRDEMLKQAEDLARQKSDDAVTSSNLEKMVEKRTKDLNEKQAKMEREIDNLKNQLGKAKEGENSSKNDLIRVKDEFNKCRNQVAKLKTDKQRLESDNEELRRKMEHPIGLSEKVASGSPILGRTPKTNDTNAATVAHLRDQLRTKEAECIQLTHANEILKGALEKLGKERDELLRTKEALGGLSNIEGSNLMGSRLESEGLRKEVIRLREKCDDLEKYVDLLKTENSQLSGRGSGGGLSAVSGNVRRIGESGRSPAELERTIALLKKVIDRLQNENEIIKKSTEGISNAEVGRLRTENRDLKDRIHELEQSVGQAVAERYSAVERGAAKLSNEYDKLRMDLKKEIEAHQRADVVKEQLARELAETKQQLALTIEQVSCLKKCLFFVKNFHDKNFQSEKQSGALHQSTSNDLERHKARIGELTKLLKDASDREQKFIAEIGQQRAEIARLKKELANFGPEFFEELENLKHSYGIVVREKKELEERLKRAMAVK